MSARRCCTGGTYTRPLGTNDLHTAWEVVCDECERVLAVVEAPRDEVYAHV